MDLIPRAGRPFRDGSSNSQERSPHDTPAWQAAPQSQQQLKRSPGAGSEVSPRQKASLSQQQQQYEVFLSHMVNMQQVQTYGQGLNKKVQDQQDLQWQQQHQEV